MSIQITLPAELEDRLRQEAERRGLEKEVVALHVLDEHLPPAFEAQREAAVELLRSWAKEDDSLTEEESAANAAVLQAIDEDRLSERKLFTEILRKNP